MQNDLQELLEQVKSEAVNVQKIRDEIGKIIVGQEYLVERLMVGLFGEGHLLIEGLPGLAKTTAVKALSDIVSTEFRRIQFTPDLLPADVVGTLVYNPKDGRFDTKKGPIFANIVLADEINRSPSKVQSALLEAMQEGQVTIGDNTFPLPKPFIVLATQNPLEQEGTYPLPEAQVDRFMLKLSIDYPNREEEKEIMNRVVSGVMPEVNHQLTPEDVLRMRKCVRSIYIDDKVKDYILDLVFASRKPENYQLGKLKGLISCGASPRATIMLGRAAKAQAFLCGRSFVTPEDVKSIGMDVLRHRILITYEAEAEDITSENIVSQIFDHVEVP